MWPLCEWKVCKALGHFFSLRCCLHSHSLSVKARQCYRGMTGTQHIVVFSITSKWYYTEAQSSFIKSLKHFKCSTKHYFEHIFGNSQKTIHKNHHQKSSQLQHSSFLHSQCPLPNSIPYNKEQERGRVMCRFGHSVQGAHEKCRVFFFFQLQCFHRVIIKPCNKEQGSGRGAMKDGHHIPEYHRSHEILRKTREDRTWPGFRSGPATRLVSELCRCVYPQTLRSLYTQQRSTI